MGTPSQVQLQEAMELLCDNATGSDTGISSCSVETPLPSSQESDDNLFEDSFEMEELTSKVQGILKDETDCPGPTTSSDTSSSGRAATTTPNISNAGRKALNECYDKCHQERVRKDKQAEFHLVEDFVLQEQNNSRDRRAAARKVGAAEEKRLASEVAQLKGLRLKIIRQSNDDDDLRWKLNNAERAYVSRKMVYAKAAQVAGSELRSQFARVREFLQQLNGSRQKALWQQHRRSTHFQALVHTLKGTDARVVALDRQIAQRLYRKKKSDLNELHLQQTLEEAAYLESMMNIIDKTQTCKETAARELFDLHVQNLKEERNHNARRNDEMELFAASATLEMAKLVAQYTEEDAQDLEHDDKTQQQVEAMERSKTFRDTSKGADATNQGTSAGIMSVSKLYDTVLWSVATNDLGLTSSGSSLYSTGFADDEEPYLMHTALDSDNNPDKENKTNLEAPITEEAGVEEEYAEEELAEQAKLLTPMGKMLSRQLAKELKVRERALLEKHRQEIKVERRGYTLKCKALREKHQKILDDLVEKSLIDTQKFREAIAERMEAMAVRQDESTEQMRKRDLHLMKEALYAEDQRLAEAEANSFIKAQELISAQVFHEVRNALSSVIAMSEITDTLKHDNSVTPQDLISSVDDMMDQISDVVNYALKMLNEVLDVSKINSGAFIPHKEVFDLNDVVARATRMQQAKAGRRIRMTFTPTIVPSCIALSDPDIVERIVATLISNAVKFTSSGAVQTFVCPAEKLRNGESNAGREGNVERSEHGSTQSTATTLTSFSTASMSTLSEESNRLIGRNNTRLLEDTCDALPIANKRMKMVAVGVADSGIGLSDAVLQSSKFVISSSRCKASSRHGVQNTGFGLYHAHLQTRALDTHLQLADVGDCRDMLNNDILSARKEYELLVSNDSGHGERPAYPGRGAILYFTVPAYEDCNAADRAFRTARIEETLSEAGSSSERSKGSTNSTSHSSSGIRDYLFRPRPAPDSKGGCFRILVADDILMLRKGLVHTIGKLWSENFPDCPVSVSTACTAEDVLRAATSEPFDLIICDHLFNEDTSGFTAMSTEERARGTRKRVLFTFNSDDSSSPQQNRALVSSFFADERFTIEEKDGKLQGLDALIQLVESESLPFPVPTLMLVSGNKIDLEDKAWTGIIVAQKPLKHSDFIASLEGHARELLRAGRCRKRERQRYMQQRNEAEQEIESDSDDDDKDVLINAHGTQMFVRNTECLPIYEGAASNSERRK